MDRKLISCFVSSELRRQAGSLARGQDISSEGEEERGGGGGGGGE